MFNITLVRNYILAELAHIGMELDDEGVSYSVSHCQGDYVELVQYILPNQLQKAVFLYIEYLMVNGTEKSEAILLGRKLQYFLKVYEENATDRICVTASNYGSCNIDAWNITEDILHDALHAPEHYNCHMEINGEVLISRLVLKRFWDHEFIGFLEFIADMLRSAMVDAYNTLSEISMAQYDCNEYVYKRKINSELFIEISYQSDDDLDDLDVYMVDVTLPNGEVVQRRNDEGLISFYHGAAIHQNLPVTAYIKFKDKFDCEVFSTAMGTYVTKGKGDMYHMADHREIIHQAMSEFRSDMKHPRSEAA